MNFRFLLAFKTIFVSCFLFTFFLSSCNSSLFDYSTIEKNRTYKDSKGNIQAIGLSSLDFFRKEPFVDWYKPNYEEYNPEHTFIRLLKPRIQNYHIEVFLATWCSDSKLNFPRLIKVLKQASYPTKKLKIYAVNMQKDSFSGETLTKNIVRVPTIIVYKDGVEKGRIIEDPEKSIEEDLLNIIASDLKTIKKQKNIPTVEIIPISDAP